VGGLGWGHIWCLPLRFRTVQVNHERSKGSCLVDNVALSIHSDNSNCSLRAKSMAVGCR
jgi:hypothetical protein